MPVHVTLPQLTLLACLVTLVSSAPCCAPDQWASQVRVITMTTDESKYQANYVRCGTRTWHWVSYDFNRSLIAIITVDPFHPDVYQRELLDYPKGVRYVTPDEFKCFAYPLQGAMMKLCVPPPGGNVSFDVPMLFGFVNTLPTDVKPVADSNGMFGETIYYDNGDVTGYVTVATPSCAFVNEMSYATLPDGASVWRNVQWTNITLTLDPENFKMPSACNMSTWS
ncbi:hypothetical protein C0Q70_03124 [Pomacea canaliculata]|uniref:Uncharacterized protein n=1 Tax=Pomacea canaliculata TaxID=400727 RepID=A0A2T7PRU6_POMCA|nr:hypothetical protein C0Q70_03124 [Pomacea canaliculata]